jgi:hypothetical protein
MSIRSDKRGYFLLITMLAFVAALFGVLSQPPIPKLWW